MLEEPNDQQEAQRTLADILKTLTAEQLRFVDARLSARTDAEAAKNCGLTGPTVYSWDNKADVNEAVRLAAMDGLTVARERLKRLSGQAIDTLGKAMTEGGRYGKHVEAALAILDRIGMSPKQTVEVSGQGGGPVGVAIYLPDNGRTHDGD